MNIAIIDDQIDIRYAVEKILKNNGHNCYQFTGVEEDLIDGLDVFDIELIILDMMLEKSVSGLDVLEKIRKNNLNIPTVLITAYTTPSNLISASKSGIVDIIEKPFSSQDILNIINKYKKDEQEDQFLLKSDNEEFIGSFETMKEVYRKIGIAAKSEINVFIFGETGTGKELVSKLIHKNSLKSQSPFIAINCATIPENMFESLFFGYKKNAFKEAKVDHKGYVEQVEDGTLFLDEISELKISLQSKLLRFLETKKYTPLGASEEIEFKGRIICASVQNPKQLIDLKEFRKDLYFRISMIEIELPNLSKRVKDIKNLALHFIKLANQELGTHIVGIDEAAIEFLEGYKFLGNVRELKNTIYKASLSSGVETISLENIKNILQVSKDTSDTFIDDTCKTLINTYGVENAKMILEKVESGIIKELLNRCKNISKVKDYLDVSRNTLKSKIDKYNLS